MKYLIILFGILAVACFGISFHMYLRDKRHKSSSPSKRRIITQDIPSYELSSWIDDEVAARKLYSKTDISVAELADELGISKQRLKHTINNAYSRTVTEYLDDRRIQAACRMLREQPDRSIEEIGAGVGLASIPAFRKLFVRTMGQTPEQYRQMAKQINNIN